jgi:glycosyltransferase involved in cell wall biosynthesis
VLHRVIPPEADVVVLQRPLSAERVLAAEQLQQMGRALVIEVDDDFTCPPQENPAWWQQHPRFSPSTSWRWLMRIIKAADLVTVTTPYLAERYGRHHGRVRIIPNYVPARYLAIRPESHEGVIVGWPGSTTTHPGDLEITHGAVGRAVAATDARFRAIGGEGTCAALDIPDGMGEHVPWTKTIEDYPAAVAELDVGIAPLKDTRFSLSKSWLKPLEYSALGVAFVASPLPEYAELYQRGAGRIAFKPRGWERELRRLIEDEEWRSHIAGRGREVAATLTIEEHCGQWWDAWEEAWEIRQRRSLELARRTSG